MTEIEQLFEKKKHIEAELGKVNGRIWQIQRECKHPNSREIQGPEAGITDTFCPDCKHTW